MGGDQWGIGEGKRARERSERVRARRGADAHEENWVEMPIRAGVFA